MTGRRLIALAMAALLALAGALYLSTQRNLPRDTHGRPLLPALAAELDTVTAVTLRRGSTAPTATVHQQDDRWNVAERADYPADVPKLRKLLLALADAKIVEEKTSNARYFSAIGVEDPAAPGAAGAEVAITARGGRQAVIVGKAAGDGNFVRHSGENQTYSVAPGISFETDPRFWIDPQLLDLVAADIKRIEVKPQDGPGYAVRREATGANYALDGVPAGRKAADAPALAPSPTLSGALTADDVTASSGVDFSKAAVATFTMTDGSVITIKGTAAGDKHWITLQSSKDKAFDAKAAGRAFEIAGYRFDTIFRPLEQLLAPKSAPAPGKPLPPAKKPQRTSPQ